MDGKMIDRAEQLDQQLRQSKLDGWKFEQIPYVPNGILFWMANRDPDFKGSEVLKLAVSKHNVDNLDGSILDHHVDPTLLTNLSSHRQELERRRVVKLILKSCLAELHASQSAALDDCSLSSVVYKLSGEHIFELGQLLQYTTIILHRYPDDFLLAKYIQAECFVDLGRRVFDDPLIKMDWFNTSTNGYLANYLVSLIIGVPQTRDLYTNARFGIKWKPTDQIKLALAKVLTIITEDPLYERERAALLIKSVRDRGESLLVRWLVSELIPIVGLKVCRWTRLNITSAQTAAYVKRRNEIRQRFVNILLANTRLCKNLSSLIVEYLYDE